MARATSGSAAKRKPAGNGKKAASPNEKQTKKNARNAKAEDAPRFLDERTRRDIAGLVISIAAIALFIAVLMPSDAVVTSFISTVLHNGFGIGSYLLPFFLLVIGASFLIRFERQQMPLRVAIGLIMIYLSILALLSLFTPLAATDASAVFGAQALLERGGYIGAGIAWAGLMLFGQVITGIILFGIIIAGLVVIGFSISALIEKIREKRIGEEGEATAFDAPAFMKPAQRSDDSKAGLGAQETSELTRSGKKPRKARASIAMRDDGEATQVLSDDGADRALTRKLGKKKPKEGAGAATGANAAQKTAVLTAPQPLEGFELPAMSLLKVSSTSGKTTSDNALRQTAMRLQETLGDFGILAEVVGWVAGPTVTLFKVDLPAGVRVSRVTALEDDIALALAAPGVRIFAPIPGTNYVGIEVPNSKRQSVLLGDVLRDAQPGPLQIAIGKDVEGESIISDLAKMPHLLIGGTTGSGKSVSINAMIMSILMRATPSEVRFIMIDPKRVEFTPYNGIPHLYVPVVTESREAASALSWGVAEMERRLKVFSKHGARNINQYNAKVQSGALEDEAERELPYIVIIIDELADLMMNVGKEVEFSISRLAQLARAAGIHLIVATQRPSANVVTGLIKANITNRIAFNVASGIDSRVVLDTPGAENLIGLGDLLLSKPEYPKPQRIQGCFVSEDEINSVVKLLKEQGEPEYHSEILSTNLITLGASSPDGSGGSVSDDDPLIWEAADIVVASGLGSTSNIQRRLKVGYSRAGRIMDMLEEKGVVGPPNGSKPREVLVDAMELETLRAFETQDESSARSAEEG